MRLATATLLGVFCALCHLEGTNAAETVPQGRPPPRQAQTGWASWYSVASAMREGTCTDPATRTCLMANGRALDDKAYTAASWDHAFGTYLTVCQTDSGDRRTCVQTVVRDRGPARRLYRQGRILDLSQAAFQVLAPLSQGLVQVEITEVKP